MIEVINIENSSKNRVIFMTELDHLVFGPLDWIYEKNLEDSKYISSISPRILEEEFNG